ncbi:MAG TPA: ATP-binding protein, partial [Terrimicrobiaceae bacterium]|nr:ATP-binding protein [Terrimicrobiaceae bacterium]
LARPRSQPVEFLEASLEGARFVGAERDRPLVEFLGALFRDAPPDLIAAIGGPAALFFERHREELFPKTPVLVVAADRRRVESFVTQPGVINVGIDVGLPRLMENILQVLPRTRHVYVVMGSAPLDQFWESELKREWAPFADRLTLHWLSDRSVAEMREIVGQVPPESVVFWGIISRDAKGIPFEDETALTSLREVTKAPIFGYADYQIGLGIVGGTLAPLQAAGAAAADLAARFLDGELPSSKHSVTLPMADPVYDWRELERGRIPESALPPGSAVLYREPSLWQTHRTAVLVALAVTAGQTLLIALLFAARRRARDMAASLNLAAESANTGLWQLDAITNEIKASAKWRELFDLREKQPLMLADVLDRIHPDDQARMHQVVSRARQGAESDVEYRIVLSDDSVRWIASRSRPELAHDGRVLRIRGASMDITNRKRMEEDATMQRNELTHLSRVASLGVLSGSLAHEINQPLGIILSNAQAAQRLLAREQPDLAELREILSDIVSEDRRAGDVIKRLRTMLKRDETSIHPVEVHEAFEEVLRLAHGDLVGRGVAVERRFATGLPPVQTDRIQLQQVLLNLIVNACDAMETTPSMKRSLTLTTAADGNGALFTVADCGIGLPSDREELFQPFHTTKPNGLGMGLAICRTIIDAHRGRLWAEANPECGACFYVWLPWSPESP